MSSEFRNAFIDQSVNLQGLTLKMAREIKTDHKDIILSICAINHDIVATGSKDFTIKLWKISTGQLIGDL